MTTMDNRVICWGLNSSGQVGDATTTDRPKAVFVKDLAGVTQLTLGSRHSCAITNDGSVWCWGENSSGQLGNGTTVNSSVPVQVVDLPAKATSFTAGENFTCAMLDNSSVWCWGENGSGQLNDGTTTNQPKPVQSLFTTLPSQISGGQFDLVAEATGQVSLWGNKTPLNITGLTDALNISGNRFTPGGCAVTAGGLVECWAADKKPGLIDTVQNALTVGTGLAHGCAVNIDNNVFCWGKNSNGELGDGKTIDHAGGAPVIGLSPVAMLAVGAQHTCVLVGNGTAMCWGANNYGQLGNNSNKNSSVPVLVILPYNLGH